MNEIIFNSKNEFLSCFPEIKNYFEKCVFNHLIKYIDNINNFIISSDNANKEISDQKQKIDEFLEGLRIEQKDDKNKKKLELLQLNRNINRKNKIINYNNHNLFL